MELFKRKIPANCNIYQIGDTHEGTIMQSRPKLLRAIDIIRKDKSGLFVFMGDAIEGRAIDDDRYDSDINTEPVPFRQADQVIKDFDSIKKKCIVWLEGNHDNYARLYVRIVQDHICKRLGVPFGTWSCKVSFQDSKGNTRFKSFFIHGAIGRGITRSRSGSTIRRHTNEKDSLKNLLSPAASDCIYMGVAHYHRQIVYDPTIDGMDLYLYDDGDEIRQSYVASDQSAEYIHPDLRYYGCSGAFLKAHIPGKVTYAEKAMYPPVEIGMLKLIVRDYKLIGVEKIAI